MRQSSKSSSTPASESSSTPPEAAADILPVSDAFVDGGASPPVDASIEKPSAPKSGLEHHSKHLGKDPTPVDTAIYEPLAPGHSDKHSNKGLSPSAHFARLDISTRYSLLEGWAKLINEDKLHEAELRFIGDMLLLKHEI